MTRPPGERHRHTDTLSLRGVAYDTGTNFATGQGSLSRAVWSRRRMLDEISLISDQLNCNSVTVYGSDLGRLADTASEVAERGLHVRLQPRLVDRPRTEILEHLAEAARLAESLRAQGADIDMTVGAVHLLFTPGLIEGEQYHERMADIYADAEHHLLTPTGTVDFAAAAPRLDEFLAEAHDVVGRAFGGEVGYSAAPFEDVDWRRFDFIGLMYQYVPVFRTPEQHIAELREYRRWGRPVDIAEFGTATYRGAEHKAFFFWDVVERSGPVPTILDGHVRDEGAQAAYHLRMFDVFEQAGIRAATVSEFIHPTHPHSADPTVDLDMASMALVKTIRTDPADPASDYQVEPKESFHAIADHYAHLGFQTSLRR
ncbi:MULTISPECIES: abortive infection protein [Actinoalloteichus]|uniref:Abortive infection protein n=1 Tax=Actinoalloteichus fjordicus TaxID=1612552 RepID=A0AAC9LET7_9PSEU|nr:MULTISPECIES: abortive infection protein [Actinoalloteichus]APU15540.1 hypothetical protein UA74_17560 [Actinoalloteichus fjordicus]APU21607.1 hypothetical protein UA75_18085 [Actinoalloteichus sp. GBA129-24]